MPEIITNKRLLFYCYNLSVYLQSHAQGNVAPYFANILSTVSRSFGEMEINFKPAFMISSPSHAGIKI